MAFPFRAFPGICQNEPRNLLPAIGTVQLDVTLSGSVILEDPQAATCTPDPRPFTCTVTGTASATWTRENIHGADTTPTPATDKFAIWRFNCEAKGSINFVTDGAKTTIDGGVVTCEAPEVTCITPPSTIPPVDRDTDIDITISVAIFFVPLTSTFTVQLLCEVSPSIGCVETVGTVDSFLKSLTGLSAASAFSGRTETVDEPLGDGDVSCQFVLAFS